MSIRKILNYGDNKLRNRAKEINKISKKIQTLAEDMLDTMYSNNGVGLAAPQVGELLRLVVIDVWTNQERYNPLILINPKIIKREGAISCNEGCLSFPGVYTDVRRYKNVTVKAQDLRGKTFIIEAKDGELLSRALQHEIDHLDGILFVDHVRNRFETDNILSEKGLPPIDPEMLMDESLLEDMIKENEQRQEDTEGSND